MYNRNKGKQYKNDLYKIVYQLINRGVLETCKIMTNNLLYLSISHLSFMSYQKRKPIAKT